MFVEKNGPAGEIADTTDQETKKEIQWLGFSFRKRKTNGE
jgi:hypothetical protein